MVFTIGHGKREIDDFINLLMDNHIELVVDVRSFPYSRFSPQYRKRQLEEYLENRDVKYLFLGEELGGRPANPELYNNGKLDYPTIKKTALFKKGITKVTDLVKKNLKVALMCSESNPNDCHRKHLLSDEFIKQGITVWHIGKNGNLEKHSHNISLGLFD